MQLLQFTFVVRDSNGNCRFVRSAGMSETAARHRAEQNVEDTETVEAAMPLPFAA
jgi:hypothetical protein